MGTICFTSDYNGNMLTVTGSMFDPKTMVYNDDNRMKQITYNNGNTTDYYYYQYTGLRYRARLAGTYYRYLYNGDRVLEELNDSGTMQARYTTENGSYYGMWLHLYRSSGTLSRFPMYDNIGTVRGLVDASGTATDWYELDTFGRQVSSSGTTPNPYRYGGAWGYISDPSGMQQLGQRFYWPELGRFVSQDPARVESNWFAYARSNPTVQFDPDGNTTHCGGWQTSVLDDYWNFLGYECGGRCTKGGLPGRWVRFTGWHVLELQRWRACVETDNCGRIVSSWIEEQPPYKKRFFGQLRVCLTFVELGQSRLCGEKPSPPPHTI